MKSRERREEEKETRQSSGGRDIGERSGG